MSSDSGPFKLTPVPRLPLDPDPSQDATMPWSVARPLPTLLTSLVGRGTEVASVGTMLTNGGVRLLTLTGPGGVGKTRLAIQIGEALTTAFPDGVIFVSLAQIVAPELVLPTIARALGIRDSSERPLFETVANHLQTRRLLVILDNMEHLLDASTLIASLLTTCPRLQMLVTSRVRLHLSGEHTFRVSPLPLPERSITPRPTQDELDAIARAEAVQLFVARAAAVQSGFTVTPENAATIEAVCRQLDGLPLALELAAARLRVLSPETLLTDLEHRLRFLRDGPRDAPPRLRSMRDAIAWSVDRLAPEERSLFCRLGLFVGGFPLEAAAWMVDTSGREHPTGSESAPDALDLVTSLVDHSLVQRAESPGAPTRYHLLETIRAYALGALTASGEEEVARQRHAVWALAFAERAEPELSGPSQQDWFERLEAEQPNMRAALQWLLTEHDAERGLYLASLLNWFWSSRSYFREARHWLEVFLAQPTSAPTRGRGLLEVANILHWQGDDDAAVRAASEALAIFRDHDDTYLAMCALRRLGSIAIDQADFAEAARYLAESHALMQLAENPWDAAWDVAFAAFLSGRLAAAAHQSEEAIDCFAEAIGAFQAIGDRGYLAAALGLQGAEWLKQGDVLRAREAYGTSLDLAHEVGDYAWVAWALVGAAHLAHGTGDVMTTAHLQGAATAMREAIGERRLPVSVLPLGPDTASRADWSAQEWTQGTSLSAGDAIALARAMFAQDRPHPHDPHAAGTEQHPPSTLTTRERDVLRLLADGLGDKAIAATLGMSRRTASKHVAVILSKLDVASRTAAVSHALRQGLLDTSSPLHPHRGNIPPTS